MGIQMCIERTQRTWHLMRFLVLYHPLSFKCVLFGVAFSVDIVVIFLQSSRSKYDASKYCCILIRNLGLP